MATSTKVVRTPKPSSGGGRRARLRKVEVWVPDTKSKAFARQAHRDSVAVRNSPHADDDQAFVDAILAWKTE